MRLLCYASSVKTGRITRRTMKDEQYKARLIPRGEKKKSGH